MPSPTLTDAELLARLVAFDTTSVRGTRDIVDFIHEYLDVPGLDVTRLPGPTPETPSLLVRRGASANRADATRGLTLCGHLDCVPATEPEWTGDPFALRQMEDRWVARGACDMKGFDAIAINLLREERSLDAPLALLLTPDEERGSLGAQHLVTECADALDMPRSVIIGEPTSLRAVRMHKGHLTIRLTTRGVAAHSGSPHLGDNAIDAMVPVLRHLLDYRSELERTPTETARFFPEVPAPVLNLGRIEGGDAINVIPDHCTVGLGVRLLPDMRSEDAVALLRSTLAETPVEIEILNDNPPMLLTDDAALHRDVCELVDQHDSHGVSFASDAGALSRLGFECVLFGPGDIAVAHRPDEYVPIDEFTGARDHLEALIAKRCL